MQSIPEDIAAAIEAIRRDSLRGAAELTHAAAELLARASRHPASPPWPECRDFLVRLCVDVARTQPTMAPILRLASEVLSALGNAAGKEPSEAVESACEGFLSRLRAAELKISRRAADLAPQGGTVLTHSASTTVYAALREAALWGKNLTVYCTESRPLREGLFMARRLREAGCRSLIIVDAAAEAVMDRVSILFVGADSISSAGLTNKAGTALLVRAASSKGKPAYALCGTQKWLPHGWTLPPEEPKPAEEVLGAEGAGLDAENLYFDTCPLELFTGIVTEIGVLSPARARAELEQVSLHPALLYGAQETP